MQRIATGHAAERLADTSSVSRAFSFDREDMASEGADASAFQQALIVLQTEYQRFASFQNAAAQEKQAIENKLVTAEAALAVSCPRIFPCAWPGWRLYAAEEARDLVRCSCIPSIAIALFAIYRPKQELTSCC
jgi:hypothetical protein